MAVAPIEREALEGLHPREIRALIRAGRWTGSTDGLAEGYAQANLAAVPRADAFDFLLFCQRNPRPCPVLEVTDPGSPLVRDAAPGADLRTDLPGYRVYERGRCVAEAEDATAFWRDDLVGFLLGCSYSFLGALRAAGVPSRVGTIYTTNVPCAPAGRFAGPLIVSMRLIPRERVVRAVQVTSRFPATHGAPVHVGDPAALGIRDLNDAGAGVRQSVGPDRIEPAPGEVPVFWACGCTPQAVALAAKPGFMITHSPACCFITDRRAEELAAL